jgi:hypothetical protein
MCPEFCYFDCNPHNFQSIGKILTVLTHCFLLLFIPFSDTLRLFFVVTSLSAFNRNFKGLSIFSRDKWVQCCHQGMARPQVAVGGTASRYGGQLPIY